MNGMLGLAQLLEKEPLSADQLAMVSRLRQAGQSLLGIINDILDFSKIEAGQLRLDPQPFNLAQVLAQVASLLGVTAHGKDSLSTSENRQLSLVGWLAMRCGWSRF